MSNYVSDGTLPSNSRNYQKEPPPYGVDINTGSPPSVVYPAAQTLPVQDSRQQSSSNVVVVRQPSQVQQVSVMRVQPANDHLVGTVILLVCCLLLGNWSLLICLLPALTFSILASTYNDAGEYDLAKRFGSLACKCNIAAFMPAIFSMCAVIAFFVLTFVLFIFQ